MKKIVLCAVALVAASAVSAQTGEITSNRGENWLSQDGDWGLTFDAAPLLNYAGNLFNNGNNSNVAALNNLWSSSDFFGIGEMGNNPGGSNVVIGAKKLIDANTAYRGKLRIGFGTLKHTDLVNQVPAPSGDNDPPAQVDDVTKDSFMAVNLGVGLEKRVGSTRVVGVYGAEFNVGFGNSKTVNEYGNALSADNPGGPRTTEVKHGSVFGLGLNGFVGVEWFAAPKISLSGEYTWGLAMRSRGHNETTTENWNAADERVDSRTIEG
ncbi:MAG: hypothetical protein RBT71_06095, partial [Flavobacteriales bacterium]|nr:hypothetical protein [Flavobacteriales bacterium]